MKQLYFSLISILVFFSALAFSNGQVLLPHAKRGELDFGVVRRGQIEMRTASLVNRTNEAWVVPLIEVSGKGYRLMGRNFAYIAAHSTGDFLIKFTVDPDFAPGIYEGKCVIYVRNPDGAYESYEYALKAQVME